MFVSFEAVYPAMKPQQDRGSTKDKYYTRSQHAASAAAKAHNSLNSQCCAQVQEALRYKINHEQSPLVQQQCWRLSDASSNWK